MTVQNSTVNCFAQLTDDIADDVIDLGLGGILSEWANNSAQFLTCNLAVAISVIQSETLFDFYATHTRLLTDVTKFTHQSTIYKAYKLTRNTLENKKKMQEI